MGSNVSTQKAKSLTKVVTESMSSIVNKQITETQTTASSTQEMIVEIGGNLNIGEGCTIKFQQTSDIKISNTVDAITELDAEKQSELANDLASKIKSEIEQTNEDLNLFQSNVSYNETDAATEIENSISTSIEQFNETLTRTDASADQRAKITINYDVNCEGGTWEITQESVIGIVSEIVAENILSSSESTSVVNKATTDITAASKQYNKGVDVMAMCGFCMCAVCVLAIVGGLTSTTMWSDTPDEAKVALGEAAGEAIKARAGKIGKGGRGKKKPKMNKGKSVSEIEQLLQIGGLGAAGALGVGGGAGMVCSCCCCCCCLLIYFTIVRQYLHKNENVFEEQNDDDEDKDNWWQLEF